MHIQFELVSLGIQAQFSNPKAPAVLLIGQAGIGKNKGAVEPITMALEKNLVWLPAPRHESADMNGYPAPDFEKGVMRQLPPQWAHTVSEKGPQNFVVFIDEIADADSQTQAACHGLLQDGYVADLNLSGAAFIAAMNPAWLATTGGSVSHPITNRCLVIDPWAPPVNDIIDCMMRAEWPKSEIVKLPDNWQDFIPESWSRVGLFLKSHPQLLRISEEDLLARGENIWKPANTDRSWENFFILRAAALASGQNHLVSAIADGTVGTSAGLTFLQWDRNMDLGDPEDYLSNPTSLPVPEEDDRCFALAAMVIGRVITNNTSDRWHRGWQFLNYLRNNEKGDIAAVQAITLARNRGAAKGLPRIAIDFLPALEGAGLVPRTEGRK